MRSSSTAATATTYVAEGHALRYLRGAAAPNPKAPEGEKGKVVGIDLLPIDTVPGATVLLGDFLDERAPEKLKAALGGPVDLVLSDMAANTTGHHLTDALRTAGLAEAAASFRAEIEETSVWKQVLIGPEKKLGLRALDTCPTISAWFTPHRWSPTRVRPPSLSASCG